jgi:molybdopterin-guanine dinucleotide biosynthesis protein A
MKNIFIKDCTGVILAGGENRRMPVLKGFIEVGGEKIIERNLKILKRLFSRVFIVTNQPELYVHFGVPMLGDVYDTRGPMTGVLTALLNSSTEWVFVSACDMPFIDPGLIRFMADERYNPVCLSIMNAKQKQDLTVMPRRAIYDIVVPVVNQRAEPLFAYYSKKIQDSLEEFVLSGKKGIKYFLLNRNKRVKYITSDEIKDIDPEARSFINLNTPEDIDTYLSQEDKLKFNRTVKKLQQTSL